MISGYQSARCGGERGSLAAGRSLLGQTVTVALLFITDKYSEFCSANDTRWREMATKKFSREQVSKYNSKTESVFIIDNVVYDISKFLDEHPGGHEVLLNQVGKDASEDFEDVGHSIDAKELMKKYVVGEVVEEEHIERQKRNQGWEVDSKEQEPSFVNTWKFPVLLGVLVTILYSYLFG